MNTQEIYEKLHSLWGDFEANHSVASEKNNKAAAGRARKALNEIKKLVTPYKKESVEAGKK